MVFGLGTLLYMRNWNFNRNVWKITDLCKFYQNLPKRWLSAVPSDRHTTINMNSLILKRLLRVFCGYQVLLIKFYKCVFEVKDILVRISCVLLDLLRAFKRNQLDLDLEILLASTLLRKYFTHRKLIVVHITYCIIPINEMPYLSVSSLHSEKWLSLPRPHLIFSFLRFIEILKAPESDSNSLSIMWLQIIVNYFYIIIATN